MNQKFLFVVIALGALAIDLIALQQSDLTQRIAAPKQQGVEIRLNFGEMFVLLNEDGKASVVHYSPYQGVVFEAYEGFLSEEHLGNVLSTIQKPSFHSALERCNVTSSGISEERIEEGNPFSVSLEVKGTVIGACSGLRHLAPKIVQSLVDDLLRLYKQLDPVHLAEAYVRSFPIEQERLERLLQAGRLRFGTLEEFPADLQPILATVIRRPSDFFALNQGQYDRLFSWTSHGHDLFVIKNNSGYQLSLFRSGSAKGQDSKGD